MLAFLVLSAALARLLATAGAERAAVIEAVKARAAGEVRVLRFDGPSRLALGTRTGTARIVWSAGTGVPVVQCAHVQRRGDLVSGFEVSVRRLSRPIGREAGC